MSLTTKTVLLAVAIIASIGFRPAAAYGPPTPDAPGVCWDANASSSDSDLIKMEPPLIGTFCFHLRGGINNLGLGRGMAALEQFRAAQQDALAIADAESRARAQDEARAATALSLEFMGQIAEAVQMIAPRGDASRDTLALARGYMLARQEDYEGAINALESAKRQMPDFWCDTSEQALSALRARAAGKNTEWPKEANSHHLPSYLRKLQRSGECTIKTAMATTPTTRAFHAAFDLGERKPGPKAQAALREMADHLAARKKNLGADWRWVVVGHADEKCPKDRKKDCGSSNMVLSRDRAEAAKVKIEAMLREQGIVPPPMRIDYRGMEEPLYPRGFDIADHRNRRVQLVPEKISAAGGPTLRCPWEVTVYRGDIAGGAARGGVSSTPTMVLTPGATVEIGRNAGYSIRYVPGQSTDTMRYFYAFSETGTAQTDLAAMAGLTTNELKTLLAQGGQLPRGQVFQPDSGAREETIRLYVSNDPVSQLEEVRHGPHNTQVKAGTSKGGGGSRPLALADRRYMGPTKEWAGHTPKLSRFVDYPIDGDPAHQPPKPAPPATRVPVVMDCTFRLSIR